MERPARRPRFSPPRARARMPKVRLGLGANLKIELVVFQSKKMDVALVVHETGPAGPLGFFPDRKLEERDNLRPGRSVILGKNRSGYTLATHVASCPEHHSP